MEVITLDNIGIIGAGKVGSSLGRYFFSDEDYNLVGYYSRSQDSAIYAAKLTNSAKFNNLETLVKKSNIILITTPDDSIKDIWDEISCLNIQNKIIGHCSGSLSSDIFFDISSKGAYGCSIHPIMAISSKEYSYKVLKDAFFTLEGDNQALDFFEKLLDKKNNKYKVLSFSDKTEYHLSSVFVSNLFISLGNISIDLMSKYGFSEKDSLEALSSLIRGNVESFIKNGTEKSLTGPVERNDVETIKKHLGSVDGRKREIYRLLSLELLDIASRKNESKDYTDLKYLLDEKGL